MNTSKKRKTVTRVVRPKADAATMVYRLNIITQMMRTMQWERGRSAGELGEQWGVSQSAVERLAGEASRIVARDIEPESLKPDLTAAMREIVRNGKPIERIKAADVAAKLIGVYAAQKIEVSTERALFDALPREEQIRRLREKAAELTAAADDLEREVTAEVKQLSQ
jgi:hypothetical protein